MKRKAVLITILMIVGILLTVSYAQAENKLVVCTYGGKWGELLKKVYLDPFSKEYGIKVVQVLNPMVAKIKGMVISNNVEWDVVELGGAMMLRLKKEGLLEKMDYSYFKEETLAGLDDNQKDPYGPWFMIYSIVLAYDESAFPQGPPQSWAEFWDVKKFPGPRCLKSGGGGGHPPIEEALLADGVPLDKIYPCDLKRAYKSLSKIRPHVTKWWETGAVPAQLLTDKEVVLTSAYHGRIDSIKRQGAKVNWVWNQGKMSREHMVIPKGTKNYDAAMKFIAFCLRAENQAAMSNNYPNGAVNKNAYKYISAERAKQLPSSPENYKKQLLFNDEFWSSTDPKTGRTYHELSKEMWDAWLLE
jgi:putative spermidine/putrescine transport system substrate-binding protein